MKEKMQDISPYIFSVRMLLIFTFAPRQRLPLTHMSGALSYFFVTVYRLVLRYQCRKKVRVAQQKATPDAKPTP
jgi:hypothetical protein